MSCQIFLVFVSLLQVFSYFEVSSLTVELANDHIASNKDKVNLQYRLAYHFMAPLGWINDPNGFIFFKGEYHLFYQFNPYGSQPNKIHWGHAKSKDLLVWEHLPVALAPDQPYDDNGVFSGSAIEKDGKLYVMYTGNSEAYGQVQCIAFSEDGINFTKIPQNPVLDASTLPSNAERQDFRDPKVIKHENTYYVVLASKTKTNTGQILLYQSSDLITWTFKSVLLTGSYATGIMWECPDLFQLDGKDVLVISPIEMPSSGDDYRNYDSVIAFVGNVDWETGTMTYDSMKEVDHGMDFYATQSLLDNNGRRIAISWMSMWQRNYPTHDLNHGWTGAMTIPRQITLQNGHLLQTPACDFTTFFENSVELTKITLDNELKEFDKVSGAVGVLDLVISPTQNSLFTIELRKNVFEKTVISYDAKVNILQLDRRVSGHLVVGNENPQVFSRRVYVPLEQQQLKLKVLIDQSSVEIFANGGIETLSANIYPTSENSIGISFGASGKIVVESLRYLYTDKSVESSGYSPTCLVSIFLLPLFVFRII